MLERKAPQAQPETKPVQGDPVVVLDVAAQAPSNEGPPASTASTPEGGQQRLEDLLPAITELARKVGGFRRLAEIAHNLDQHRV